MYKIRTNPVRTVLLLSTAILFISLITGYDWLSYFALITGIIGVFFDSMCNLLDKGWMKLTGWMGLVMPNILFGIVFFLIFVPISFILRGILKKDLLNLKVRNSSMFTTTTKEFPKENFLKLW